MYLADFSFLANNSRQDGTAGSCGSYHSDASHVIAVPEWMSNKHCGKSVTIKYGSKTTQATIQDTCPSCNGYAIDLSRGAFGALAAYSVGEMEVKWWIN